MINDRRYRNFKNAVINEPDKLTQVKFMSQNENCGDWKCKNCVFDSLCSVIGENYSMAQYAKKLLSELVIELI